MRLTQLEKSRKQQWLKKKYSDASYNERRKCYVYT